MSAMQPSVSNVLAAALVSSTFVAALASSALSYSTKRSVAKLEHRLGKDQLVHSRRVEGYEGLWSLAMGIRECRTEDLTGPAARGFLDRLASMRSSHGMYFSPAVATKVQYTKTLLHAMSEAAPSDDERRRLYESALELQEQLRSELQTETLGL